MAQASPSVSSSKGTPAGPPGQPGQPAVGATAQAQASAEPAEPQDARFRRVEGIVRRNVYWALGLGIVPFPIVDFVGITAVELKMIKELADAYGVKFTESTTKSLVGSLAVSIGSVSIAGAIASSLVKVIPVVGTAVGVVGVSALAGAFTQALGNVFITHFEMGGTLLNFNPAQMRAHFHQEFEQAKVKVTELQNDEQAKERAKSAR
jgi:uncharacterized protein (DUF697 family)